MNFKIKDGDTTKPRVINQENRTSFSRFSRFPKRLDAVATPRTIVIG